jgi:hypothetical protein
MMTEHFTAWLTTERSCLDGDFMDVSVLRDEPFGEDGWTSTTERVAYGVTMIKASDQLTEAGMAAAVETLELTGWRKAGEWEAVSTGYVVTAERIGPIPQAGGDPYGEEFGDWEDPLIHDCTGCDMCTPWQGRTYDQIRAERRMAVAVRRAEAETGETS